MTLVQSKPGLPANALQHAIQLHHDRRYQEARYIYLQYLQTNSGDATAWKMLSVLYHECKQHDRALQAINKAIQASPKDVSLLVLKGAYFNELKQYPESIEILTQACKLDNQNVEAFQKLGYAYQQNKQYQEAIRCFQHTIKLCPEQCEPYTNLGAVFLVMEEYDSAESYMLNALNMNPEHATANANLGMVYIKQRRFVESEAYLRKALKLNPGLETALCLCAKTIKEQGRLTESFQLYRETLRLEQPDNPFWNNFFLTTQYMTQLSSEELFQHPATWGEHLSKQTPKVELKQRDWLPNRPLRIGYVSGDLRNHSVGYFIENVIHSHNKEQFQIYCYSNSKTEDDLSQRLKGAVHQWRAIHPLDDAAAARLIRDDAIDIVIDLSGHTADNCLQVFAAKPAPIQATWLGYFATTGLPEMDVIIADQYVVPPGEERYYIERVERMPNSYLCFTPPQLEATVKELPCHKNGFITFGCFNAVPKLNETVFENWAAILKRIENSRLLLKTNGCDDAVVRQRIKDSLCRYGVEDHRIEVEAPSPRAELLDCYNRIDIALDPFPFNGGTTSAEALWMGTPVVTKTGDRFVSHVGESILQAVGLPEFIASTWEDYIQIAVNLSKKIPHLDHLHSSLRAQLLQSPLCDAQTFTRDLENLYRRLWHDCIRQIETECVKTA
ncbi:tetratricopeptide repeat protein [bacterium]|nr:tetratricopeptide repeat protein [bacterium]